MAFQTKGRPFGKPAHHIKIYSADYWPILPLISISFHEYLKFKTVFHYCSTLIPFGEGHSIAICNNIPCFML